MISVKLISKKEGGTCMEAFLACKMYNKTFAKCLMYEKHTQNCFEKVVKITWVLH